ncbi:tetratricopeptide repeat protein [bacterium]|nr:tetratricopeptide repeat protein [bacterium]
MSLRMRCLLPCCLAMLAATVAWTREPGPAAHAGDEHAAGATQLLPRDADWAPFRLLEGQAQYLPAAIRATRNPSELRCRALFTLGVLGLPEGITPVRACLHDLDRAVRMQAAVSLALLYRADGLPGSAVALREGPAWLRFYALYGLWRLDSNRSRQALRDSRPYLSGFLLQTLDRALATRPRFRCNNTRSGAPDEKLPAYRVWDAVSGAFVRECDLWWHKGDYEQCIRAQWTAIYFDPEYVDLYTNIAWLQWSMGRHAEAISTYRQCIGTNPRSWVAHQSLGEYYWRHGQKLVAVKYLQRAADLGSPAVPRRALGHAYRDLGQADNARQVWRDILKLDPNDPIALRELQRAK